jgi:hypothetical protein
MSNLIELNRFPIVWRTKKARGPDVEMVCFLPITVAIEVKHTVADAIDKVSQIINYALNEKYDAVFLHMEEASMGKNEDFSLLESIISKYGIGIIVGGALYHPLTGSQKILRKASLNLRSNPLDLLRDMGLSAQSLSAPADVLLSLRKYFKVNDHER